MSLPHFGGCNTSVKKFPPHSEGIGSYVENDSIPGSLHTFGVGKKFEVIDEL